MHCKFASINGIKLLDADADGKQDPGETTPIGGITINLYKDTDGDGDADGGVSATTKTDLQTGAWSFSNLDPGAYVVEEVLAGSGYVSKDDNPVALTVASGENRAVDEASSEERRVVEGINGLKLLDADADGKQDPGETTPIGGITINLYKDTDGDGDADGGVFATTKTDLQAGAWSFSNLDPGAYVVEEVLAGSGYVSKDDNPVALTVASGENRAVDEA